MKLYLFCYFDKLDISYTYQVELRYYSSSETSEFVDK